MLPRSGAHDAPRVFLVDDHAMVRAGVRAELGDDVDVVGEAADVPTAVEGIRATRPDVVLLDVHLPGGGGRAVLETLRAELPDVRWLALSVSDAAEDVIAVIRAGRPGLRHQDDLRARTCSTPSAGWPTATSCSARGWPASCWTPSPRPARPRPSPRRRRPTPGLDLLSAREREVMQLLARGYTYREIGSRLFISVKTVESHASNVLRKLQLSNRNELTRWAATNRLL